MRISRPFSYLVPAESLTFSRPLSEGASSEDWDEASGEEVNIWTGLEVKGDTDKFLSDSETSGTLESTENRVKNVSDMMCPDNSTSDIEDWEHDSIGEPGGVGAVELLPKILSGLGGIIGSEFLWFRLVNDSTHWSQRLTLTLVRVGDLVETCLESREDEKGEKIRACLSTEWAPGVKEWILGVDDRLGILERVWQMQWESRLLIISGNAHHRGGNRPGRVVLVDWVAISHCLVFHVERMWNLLW